MIEIYKHKEDREKVIGRLSAGKLLNETLEVYGKDNKTVTVNITAAPIVNNKKEILYINTIVEDITEKVKLEKQLKETDEVLFSVVNSFPFELFVTDKTDRVIAQNEFSKRMFGDYMGKKVDELPIPAELKLKWKKESLFIFENNILDYEISTIKDGKIFHLRRIKAPLIANDSISGIITMPIDITEKMALQKELEHHRDNLEQLVKERTTEVRNLNDQLQRANDEMSAANDYLTLQTVELENLVEELKQTQQQLIQSEKMASIGVLTSGIAHEINNPINFISSGLTGLEIIIEDILKALNEYSIHCDNKEDCERKLSYDRIDKAFHISKSKENLPKLIDSMRSGVSRTTEIVKGLRTFSRLDAGNKLIADINELMDASLIILRNKYKDRIDIIKKYGQIEPVYCFPGKMSQVFLNILVNSIQAIENNGTIEISTQKTEASNSIEIKIKDNGQGIPEEVKNKIFDPFYTTKAVGDGTGLGLSIVHGIISEHNGEIEVFSEENKGTEFKITLPLE